jgi:hypothetical protein
MRLDRLTDDLNDLQHQLDSAETTAAGIEQAERFAAAAVTACRGLTNLFNDVQLEADIIAAIRLSEQAGDAVRRLTKDGDALANFLSAELQLAERIGVDPKAARELTADLRDILTQDVPRPSPVELINDLGKFRDAVCQQTQRLRTSLQELLDEERGRRRWKWLGRCVGKVVGGAIIVGVDIPLAHIAPFVAGPSANAGLGLIVSGIKDGVTGPPEGGEKRASIEVHEDHIVINGVRIARRAH